MGVRATRNDPRVPGLDASRPGAVDDEEARRLLRAGEIAQGQKEIELSVSRKHATIGGSFRWRVRRVLGLTLVDSDLPGTVIEPGLFRPRVAMRSCRFKDVNLDQARISSTDIGDCQFERVDLPDGRLHHVALTSTSFIRCDLRGVKFERSSMRDTRFQSCRTHRTMFRHCEMTKVTFIGRFSTLFFIDSTVADLDFSAAEPDDLVFHRTSGVRISLPRKNECFAVRAATLAAAAEEIGPQMDNTSAGHFRFFAGVHHGDHPVIVGRELLSLLRPEAHELALSTLRPSSITVSDVSAGARGK